MSDITTAYGTDTVTIYDRENGHAWIKSDVYADLETDTSPIQRSEL